MLWLTELVFLFLSVTSITTPTTQAVNATSPITPPTTTCPKLTNPANGIAGNYSDNKAPVGATSTFSCHGKYILSGAANVTCQANGNWTTAPKCELSCRTLEAPNGNASNYLNSRAPVGATSTFSCDDKYILSGAASVTCQANGNWTTEPKCELSCRKLKKPANGATGSYLDSRAPVNATSTFNCSKGYTLIGEVMVTCQANGNWSNKEPECKLCRKLSAPANGNASNYTDMKAPVGANSTFSCDDGYALNGATMVTCQANGNWSDKEPECKLCPKLNAPANGAASNYTEMEAPVGANSTFSCNTGYNLSGSVVVTCQADGSWTDKEPECKVVDCLSPNDIDYGTVNVWNTTYNQIAQYSCDPGYEMNGNKFVRCLSDGQWNGTGPQCEPINCGSLTSPRNGTVNIGQGTYKATANFSCHAGFQLEGSEQRACLADHTWSGENTSCHIQNCSTLNITDGGHLSIQSQDVVFGGLVVFNCSDGYVLYPEDRKSIQCVVNESTNVVEWDNPYPSCGVAPTVQIVNDSGGVEENGSPVYTYKQGNKTIVIKCVVVKGEPRSSINWINTTSTIPKDITTTDSAVVYQRSHNETIQELVFRELDSRADGNYTCHANNGAGSDNASIQILVEVVPHPPTNVINVSAGERNVTITWNPPVFTGHRDIIHYEMQYRLSRVSDWTNWSSNTTENIATIGGLSPHETYVFRVRAVNEIGSSNYSTPSAEIQTREALPGPVDDITASVTGPYSIQVTWATPRNVPGKLKGFYVWYGPYETTSKQCDEIINADSTGHNLTNLTAYTNYSIQVAAETGAGIGPYHPKPPIFKITEEDKPSAAPDNFTVVTIGNSNPAVLSVSWSKLSKDTINGILRGYKIQLEQVTHTNLRRRRSDTSVRNVSSDITTYLLEDLLPYTNYTLSMWAFTKIGPGPETKKKPIRTNAASPPSPTFPPNIPAEIGIDTIKIKLLKDFKPSDRYGPISHYQLLAAVFKKKDDRLQWTPSNLTITQSQSGSMPPPPYAYVIKRFSGDEGLPSDFVVGEDEDQSTSAGEEGFNGRLRSGLYYNFFLKAFVQDNDVKLSQTGNYLLNDSVMIKGEEKSSDSAVIAVVVVVVVLVILLIVIALFIYKRKQKGGFRLVDPGTKIEMETVIQNPGAAEDTFKPPGKISLKYLLQTVNRLHADGDFLFSVEYEHVEHPDKDSFTTVAADDPENRTKNRYTNINPYDHSRVHLHTSPSGADYINANHVDAYDKEKAFIATQGPVPDSISDFWRMVWEQNSHIIVMLTRLEEGGRLKCHQYWPESETQYYDDICVTPVKEVQVLPDYIIRKFTVKTPGTKEERLVSQWHYLMWPDHGVPQHPYSLLNFIHKSSTNPPEAGPIIIHCSAGVGRTGTYVALYSMWLMMHKEGKVDVYDTVQKLRYQRCMMVQTESQYIFIYEALLDLVHCGDTEILPQDLAQRVAMLEQEDEDSKDTVIELEFKRLNGPRTMKMKCAAANLKYNQSKNRFVTVVPYDETRVKLAVIPGVEGSDYINASWINSYWQRNAFIATQAPLPDTVNDFWRMISETNACTIIMLAKLTESGREICSHYWPESEKHEYGKFSVEKTSEEPYEEYTQRDFMITDEDGQSVPIRQFQYTAWPQRGSPHVGVGMTDMIGQMERWRQQAGDGPVVIHCSAGAGRTGCFIALHILLDQLKTEGIVDVFQTVRGLRLRRTAMVQTLDQYRYCYRTILDFLGSFDNYSNFR